MGSPTTVKLPPGFVRDNPPNLPPGFVRDNATNLPPGFTRDRSSDPGALDRLRNLLEPIAQAATTPLPQALNNLFGIEREAPSMVGLYDETVEGAGEIAKVAIDKMFGRGTASRLPQNFPAAKWLASFANEAGRAGFGLLDFSTTPLGMAVPSSGKLPSAAKAGVGAGFGTEMTQAAEEPVRQAIESPTSETVPRAVVQSLVAGLPLAHARTTYKKGSKLQAQVERAREKREPPAEEILEEPFKPQYKPEKRPDLFQEEQARRRRTKVEPPPRTVSPEESQAALAGAIEATGQEVTPVVAKKAKVAAARKARLEAKKPQPAPVTEEKLIISPSYDKTKAKILEKVDVPEEQKAQLAKLMGEWEQKNPERQVVTFDDIREEARSLDPKLVRQLSKRKMRRGETLDPAVRYAARETLNSLNDEIVKRRKELDSKPHMDAAERLDAERKLLDIDRDAHALANVLLPTRSQDARNLAYHRMVAERSFDSEYWLGRAKRESGLPPDADLPRETEARIRKATTAGRQAEKSKLGKQDPRALEARRELARVMSRVMKHGLLETISAFRKAGLLTGPKTHARNVGGNLAFQVLEEMSRIPASVADAAIRTMTGRRTVQGLNPRAFARASYEAGTRGVREAIQIMKEGAPKEELEKMEMHRELNSGNKLIDAYVNTTFRLMSAEDRLFRVYAFERSLSEQMELANVKKPTNEMRVQAIADAEFATFNNQNIIADFVLKGRQSLRTKGISGRTLAFGIDMIAPFIRTPTNIIARVIDYSLPGAGIKSGIKVAQAISDGAFSAEQQRAISQSIGRGSVGSALLYMGWKLAEAGLMTGTRSEAAGIRNAEEAAGRLPGAMLVNGRWRQVATFSPMGNVLTTGATLQRETTRPLRDEALRVGNVGAVSLHTVLEQPMLKGSRELIEALESPSRKGTQVLSSMAGSFVPTLVNDLASLFDESRRERRGENTLDSMVKAIQSRLPVVRNQLPERFDIFGRALEQSKVGAYDPTIATRARELTDPVSREMVNQKVSIGKPRRKVGEDIREYRLRARLTGRLMEAEIHRLVTSSNYSRLPSIETGNEARRYLIRRAADAGRYKVNELVNDERYKAMDVKQRIMVLKRSLQGTKEL